MDHPSVTTEFDFGRRAGALWSPQSSSSSCADGSHSWHPHMSPREREEREAWLSQGCGRAGLRIVIVTENFLPKVDGVTRTLARLLEHLEREGHHCMLLGPGTGMSHYASHPLVGTAGVPLILYPGLKLNFLRPKFLRVIRDFQPDVIHFVDPIWLGAQVLMAMELGWAGEEWVGEDGPALGAGITGAVVSSYHTNLATYAKLFGWSWLEPILWRFQRWLYSKTLLTLCPSPSTLQILQDQSFHGVRLWPRGVDVSQYSPKRRSDMLRSFWGVFEPPRATPQVVHGPVAQFIDTMPQVGKIEHDGCQVGRGWDSKSALPPTPPESPVMAPVDSACSAGVGAPSDRIVILYVGRMSWEKNLNLLLIAYGHLSTLIPDCPSPKLVFVGDGPARTEVEAFCAERKYDAAFMGHRGGEELAMCYASGDIFAFPSFTETFGQVVLEALASGLPVVGLDADGTRDLVNVGATGLLYRLPGGNSWSRISRQSESVEFQEAACGFASLLAKVICDSKMRREMSARASTEGVRGFTWRAAMERCVDGYRESMRIARQRRAIMEGRPTSDANVEGQRVSSPTASRIRRVLSAPLSHGASWSLQQGSMPSGLDIRPKPVTHVVESVWHLSECCLHLQ
ncbi:hypothetical protein TREMEDRAFT_26471 [Tremella mesenterica DSM 1558]|uniref:uncharacterized protein n=1 Tax=Tremella mesenterica (strain ATCC 24925 / CBS 8224 / DSM 1558 / NBRC 9311 / NRRL Y-6157 / RJB 2259-6 / UBC 559-6) TaxID=578456 RepID=UPI0003F4A3BC|nr:uncharacterized protein TREMEDRAFT_26471 [Tremella mesenterica DSM 1558]EIW72346.1 hypothetical protein TREMEDRAFT_26471 [Tremella mesenterica DSM 1558]